MKWTVLLILSLLIYSCASKKFTGPLVCEYIPAIPSRLISDSNLIKEDSVCTIKIKLESISDPDDISYTRIKITDLKTRSFSEVPYDSKNLFSKIIDPGDYSFLIHNLFAPDLTIDSIHIEKANIKVLIIQLGSAPGYRTIRLKN